MISETDLAAYNTVHDFQGGAKPLAARLGMAPSTLSNKVDPSVESHKLSLAEALALMLVTEDYRILTALASETGHVLIPKGDPGDLSDSALLELYAMINEEQGRVAHELLDALRDGMFTPNEIKRITSEMSSAISAQQAFLSRLRGIAEEAA